MSRCVCACVFAAELICRASNGRSVCVASTTKPKRHPVLLHREAYIHTHAHTNTREWDDVAWISSILGYPLNKQAAGYFQLFEVKRFLLRKWERIRISIGQWEVEWCAPGIKANDDDRARRRSSWWGTIQSGQGKWTRSSEWVCVCRSQTNNPDSLAFILHGWLFLRVQQSFSQ